MDELLAKLGEVIGLAQAKVKELNDKLTATVLVSKRQVELAGMLAVKEADLKARELAVSKIEDVVALSAKNAEEMKDVQSALRQLKIERDAFASYSEISRKELAGEWAKLEGKIGGLGNEQKALETARETFINEIIETHKQLDGEKELLDIERQKVIKQLGK